MTTSEFMSLYIECFGPKPPVPVAVRYSENPLGKEKNISGCMFKQLHRVFSSDFKKSLSTKSSLHVLTKLCVCSLFIVSCMLSSATIAAATEERCDTVFVSDFGAHPYSYENCVTQLQAAIRTCKEKKAKVLAFESGRYDFWPENAERREFFISNTSSESECPSKIKTIGMLIEDADSLTVEGNGATLMFHGKMITIALSHCKNLKLHNLHVDFERPGGSEMTYTHVSDGEVEVAVHRDTRYEIENGRMHLFGEGWRSNINFCIEYHIKNQHFSYSHGWETLSACEATEIEPGKVRFKTPGDFRPDVGNTLTIRDIIRDHVGLFINESENVSLDSVDIHYMHGLGIVGQYTNNISVRNVRCMPREGSGRILASSADFMHFSGCRGKIEVFDSRFEGAQDDPMNVHGTNLRIVEKINPRSLKLRFMHGQSYGFNAFFKGDTVAFVKASTMQRGEMARVVGVERLSDRLLRIDFDRDVPEGLLIDHDCVENITWTPEVEVRRCHFERINTKGVMATTPRKVVVADNVFHKIGRNAILLEGDAENWYESGPVNDVLIENNTFVDCNYNGGPGSAVIAMHPSNTVIDSSKPVHRNIRIIGNRFITHGNPMLYAKSTENLIFQGNKMESTADIIGKPMFILNGCRKVSIKGNDLPTSVTKNSITFENMKNKEVDTDL